ncbi:MAG: rhodanese-like domain-containing protein [Gemmatimonadales bacterium]|nr:rhodanese-like domain-containing protein [Gemmatimonadales bacterium]
MAAGRRSRWVSALLVVFVLPILIGGVVLLVAGRPLAFDVVRRMTARKFPEVEWIGAEELARWREDPRGPRPLMLDARTPEEYAVSHLRDAARIDPYQPSLQPLQGFPKDTAIVVYCAVGYRSARVARFLGRHGYGNVYNLDGSLFRWANQGRPIFRDGQPATLVHPYDRLWGLLLASDYRAQVPDIERRSAEP